MIIHTEGGNVLVACPTDDEMTLVIVCIIVLLILILIVKITKIFKYERNQWFEENRRHREWKEDSRGRP